MIDLCYNLALKRLNWRYIRLRLDAMSDIRTLNSMCETSIQDAIFTFGSFHSVPAP